MIPQDIVDGLLETKFASMRLHYWICTHCRKPNQPNISICEICWWGRRIEGKPVIDSDPHSSKVIEKEVFVGNGCRVQDWFARPTSPRRRVQMLRVWELFRTKAEQAGGEEEYSASEGNSGAEYGSSDECDSSGTEYGSMNEDVGSEIDVKGTGKDGVSVGVEA